MKRICECPQSRYRECSVISPMGKIGSEYKKKIIVERYENNEHWNEGEIKKKRMKKNWMKKYFIGIRKVGWKMENWYPLTHVLLGNWKNKVEEMLEL